MIKLEITEDQRKRARKLYNFKALNDSIMEGRSNIYGALGEVVFYDYLLDLGYNPKWESNYNYDISVRDHKIDVKTKRTTVTPRIFFSCTVASHQIGQKCDGYVFVRILEDESTAYLLGYKSKKAFFTEASFNLEGEEDVMGWKYKADCFNLAIKNLQHAEELSTEEIIKV